MSLNKNSASSGLLKAASVSSSPAVLDENSEQQRKLVDDLSKIKHQMDQMMKHFNSLQEKEQGLRQTIQQFNLKNQRREAERVPGSEIKEEDKNQEDEDEEDDQDDSLPDNNRR